MSLSRAWHLARLSHPILACNRFRRYFIVLFHRGYKPDRTLTFQTAYIADSRTGRLACLTVVGCGATHPIAAGQGWDRGERVTALSPVLDRRSAHRSAANEAWSSRLPTRLPGPAPSRALRGRRKMGRRKTARTDARQNASTMVPRPLEPNDPVPRKDAHAERKRDGVAVA